MADEELLIPALNVESGEVELRPMTAEEKTDFLDGREERAVEALDWQRENRCAEVRAVLASTDKWAARALEEGVPMTPDRIAYRQGLRALLGTIVTSDDPASVEIPAAPANPKAKAS